MQVHSMRLMLAIGMAVPVALALPEPAALPLFGLAGTAGLLLLRRRGAAVHRPSV